MPTPHPAVRATPLRSAVAGRIPGTLVLVLACLAGPAGSGCGRRPSPAGEPSSAAGPRIVSLAPSLTEIIFAIGAGDHLVGRSSVCNFPPEAVRNVPAVADFGRPNLEMLADLNPSLVVSTDLSDEGVTNRLASMGIRYLRIPCRNTDELLRGIDQLGILAGCPNEAEALHTRLQSELAACGAAVAGQPRPAVYVEIWNDPSTTCGGDTFVSELVELAGGRNVAEERQDYFAVDTEWVLAQEPDIIICAYMQVGTDAGEAFRNRPGWRVVPAVERGAVYRLENPDLVLRPGPRILEGIEALRACIAPPRQL